MRPHATILTIGALAWLGLVFAIDVEPQPLEPLVAHPIEASGITPTTATFLVTTDIELPERVAFVGFGVWSRTMGASAEIRRFEIETETGDVYGPYELASAETSVTFEATGEARRFTLRVLESTGGNTGLLEFAVFTANGS